MKINKYVNSTLGQKKEYGSLFIRMMAGFHLIYGVHDNVLSWGQMVEFANFLARYEFPLPLICASVSVYAQLICGVLFILGCYVRVASITMIFNFIVAIAVIHLGDAYPAMFPAIAMLASALFLLFNGAGKLSMDNR
jgi:putative oxidoreductase